jgi:uncharacterized membrane protein YozB (DUF420 family)
MIAQIPWSSFPAIEATLNGSSAVLLAAAWLCIKRNNWRAHATLMIAAVVTSAAFLTCYLSYHAYRVRHGVGVTRFPPSAWRPMYLSVLVSHTVLAVVILPLILTTLYFAIRRRWTRHRRISAVTLPLWLYVSVTGVVVYWMLYHLAPGLAH